MLVNLHTHILYGLRFAVIDVEVIKEEGRFGHRLHQFAIAGTEVIAQHNGGGIQSDEHRQQYDDGCGRGVLKTSARVGRPTINLYWQHGKFGEWAAGVDEDRGCRSNDDARGRFSNGTRDGKDYSCQDA